MGRGPAARRIGPADEICGAGFVMGKEHRGAGFPVFSRGEKPEGVRLGTGHGGDQGRGQVAIGAGLLLRRFVVEKPMIAIFWHGI